MVVYFAAGGPGDLIVAAAIADPAAVATFVTFSWERSASFAGPHSVHEMRGLDLGPLGYEVQPELSVNGRSDQLGRASADLCGSTYLLDLEDLCGARRSLEAVLAHDADGLLVLVDAGGDILGTECHKGLRSPLLEGIGLRLVSDIGMLSTARIVMVGAGLDNELTQTELVDRLAALPHATLTCPPTAGLLRRFGSLESETSRLWLHAASGLRGRVWADSTGRSVVLNELAAAVFDIPAEAVFAGAPADSIRPLVADVGQANHDLVGAGFVDELQACVQRGSRPGRDHRMSTLADLRTGDLATARFVRRFGVADVREVKNITPPLYRIGARTESAR